MSLYVPGGWLTWAGGHQISDMMHLVGAQIDLFIGPGRIVVATQKQLWSKVKIGVSTSSANLRRSY